MPEYVAGLVSRRVRLDTFPAQRGGSSPRATRAMSSCRVLKDRERRVEHFYAEVRHVGRLTPWLTFCARGAVAGTRRAMRSRERLALAASVLSVEGRVPYVVTSLIEAR